MWEGPSCVGAGRGPRAQGLCVPVGSQVLVSIACGEWGVLCEGVGLGGAPVLAGSSSPGPLLARRRPCGLTCLTCLPQLAGRARSPAPYGGLTGFLATEPELPSHLDFRGEGQGSGIGA